MKNGKKLIVKERRILDGGKAVKYSVKRGEECFKYFREFSPEKGKKKNEVLTLVPALKSQIQR